MKRRGYRGSGKNTPPPAPIPTARRWFDGRTGIEKRGGYRGGGNGHPQPPKKTPSVTITGSQPTPCHCHCCCECHR